MVFQVQTISSEVADTKLLVSEIRDRDEDAVREFQRGSSLLNLIKTCGHQKDLQKCSRVHAHVLKRGLLPNDVYVGTALLHMYAKCGVLAKAQEVFDELPEWDVASWNALISGYVQHGLGYEALHCFTWMQDEGIAPDRVTFISILKACATIGAVKKGEEIHAEARRQGLLEICVLLNTTLVDMYAKCGALARAQEVFDELPVRNVVTWNVLIAGYIQQELNEEALICFQGMQDEGTVPDATTFIGLLKACGSLGAGDKGEQFHAEADRQGLLKKHSALGNALVDMYAKCGNLRKAQDVFDELPAREVVSWNTLIGGYAQHGFGDEALSCYERMQDEGISPNAITFICVIKACGSLGAVCMGQEIHAEVSRQGLLEVDMVVGTSLVDMYAKCGVLTKAQEVFDELPRRNSVSWNALIGGYLQEGFGNQAFICYEQMQNEGVLPDVATLTAILKACGSIAAVEKGKEIHDEINRQGLLENHPVLGNVLVDMYCKIGVLAKPEEVFGKLPWRDIASWTALISAFSDHGHGDEALSCYQRMQEECIVPNAVTLVCVLKACGNIGAIRKGEEVHAKAICNGFLKSSTVVGIALIDMYAKYGELIMAQEVFDQLSVQNVVSWTALMAGHCQCGAVKRVFDLFHNMMRENMEPSDVMVVVLLSLCSHGGLVEEGEMCFETICNTNSITPTLDHYICMVDLFSRAGLFGKAEHVIEMVHFPDCSLLWSALLGGLSKEIGIANELL